MENQKELEEKVKAALENIRPSLQNDGGDIEFVKMQENVVFVRLKGSCAGCEYAAMTLKGGVERMLKYDVDTHIVVVNMPFEEN